MTNNIDILNTTLLTAEDICAKLSVSRSTFDRWRRIDGPAVLSGILAYGREESAPGLTAFPEPTLHVGGSPRWDAKVVNAWLAENAHKRSRRGVGILQKE